MVMDIIVLGIFDKRMQKKLLQETALTLQKTTDICRALENSTQKVEEILNKIKTDSILVNATSKSTTFF